MIRPITLLVLLTVPAHAGPWPRGQGDFFLMTSLQYTKTNVNSLYFTGYTEYGITPLTTIGFDLGHSVSGTSKAVVFLKRSTKSFSGIGRFSAELGVGKIESMSAVRPGLSYGTTFTDAFGSGWLSADIFVEYFLEGGQTDVKSDITYGRNLPNNYKAILQLQAGKQSGDDAFLRIAPSVAIPFKKKSFLEVGFSVGMRGPDEYGIKVAYWRNF